MSSSISAIPHEELELSHVSPSTGISNPFDGLDLLFQATLGPALDAELAEIHANGTKEIGLALGYRETVELNCWKNKNQILESKAKKYEARKNQLILENSELQAEIEELRAEYAASVLDKQTKRKLNQVSK